MSVDRLGCTRLTPHSRCQPQPAPAAARSSGPDLTGVFSFHRVRAAQTLRDTGQLPDEEWLIVQHPHGSHDRYKHWLCNLPADANPGELAKLARMRWTIELDYKQLKGHLGLNHLEGRSWARWHKHYTLVTVAHA